MTDESNQPDEQEGSQEIKVLNEKADDYRVVSATGIRGGVQVRGDVLLDFVLETFDRPDVDIYEFDGQGYGSYVRSEQGGESIERTKQVGVHMTQRNAYQAAIWIIQNILGEGVEEDDVREAIESNFSDKFE